MQITQFEISSDRSQIDVTITDAATVSTLRFWTDSTYKDYSKSIDLSSKLTASATENITITLSDVSLPFFDGVYFLEAEDPDELSNVAVADLTRYNECLINKVKEITNCNTCLQEDNEELLYLNSLIRALEIAVSKGFINEILTFIDAIKVFCSNECENCGSYGNTINTNYYTTPNA